MSIVYLSLFFLGVVVVWHISRGPIYLPASQKAVESMVRFAKLKPGEKAVDLGSGDGKIVIGLAQSGGEVRGYEHSLLLVLFSRFKIKLSGASGKTLIHWGDFWHANLSEYSAVTIFGIGYIMERLEKKLQKELKPGSRVSSYLFQFPSWTPVAHEEGVYHYLVSK